MEITNSGSQGWSILDSLKPYLANGSIKMIAATTEGEYQRYVQGKNATEDRFQPVKVEPLNNEKTQKVIETRMKGKFPSNFAKTLVTKSQALRGAQPRKAVKLFETVVQYAKQEGKKASLDSIGQMVKIMKENEPPPGRQRSSMCSNCQTGLGLLARVIVNTRRSPVQQ